MSAHANCDHEATKSARARCRNQKRTTPGVTPRTTKAPTVKDVKVGTPAPAFEGFKWDGSSQGFFDEDEEWVSLGGQPVTREFWEKHPDLVVEINVETWGTQPDSVRLVKIISWKNSLFRYGVASGETRTIAAERIKSAYVA